MIDALPLQSFYQASVEDSNHSPSLSQAVNDWLLNQSLQLEELAESCIWRETLMSTEMAIENWKQLLTLNLLNYFSSTPVGNLAAKVQLFERQPWNQSSQYFRALVALNHVLSKMPVPEVGPYLLESGAALIDLQEYSPWLSLPYVPYHLEFGIFLCALAFLTKREDLKDQVIRLARWQLNTVDAHYYPFASLFIRESEGKSFQNLLLYYLLFYGVSCLTEEMEFESASQALYKHLQVAAEKEPISISPLWILLERLFKKQTAAAFLPFPLPEHIYDPSTSLVGFRSNNQHAVCTLHGGHTGLGSIRIEDVELVNYGPQYLPLGDCLGFGIEGNHLSEHGLRKSIIELRRQGFVLKGCARLVDQPSSCQTGRFRGIWLEVAQEFKQSRFNLKTTFLGLDGWEDVAFSFFFKAQKCHIPGKMSLAPCTLDRYSGEAQPILLEGEQTKLKLSVPSFSGSMQVIPLAGKDNFWGSTFLVAYLLQAQQRHYHWQLEPYS
ncbi:hypothetical protein [Candidatus Protochlamydia phocaeensis]|uniref:hypothetical protein n=1 Tax=Candidatus Protochlamydia phocaeensis TaxID=1414722 RepID=UPI0008383756|nr:hypothetical protein [Candidatus Protochlamydia phocaeensis]